MGQYNRIAEAIEGKLMESEAERIMGLRQLVTDNHSGFYVIEDMDNKRYGGCYALYFCGK